MSNELLDVPSAQADQALGAALRRRFAPRRPEGALAMLEAWADSPTERNKRLPVVLGALSAAAENLVKGTLTLPKRSFDAGAYSALTRETKPLAEVGFEGALQTLGMNLPFRTPGSIGAFGSGPSYGSQVMGKIKELKDLGIPTSDVYATFISEIKAAPKGAKTPPLQDVIASATEKLKAQHSDKFPQSAPVKNSADFVAKELATIEEALGLPPSNMGQKTAPANAGPPVGTSTGNGVVWANPDGTFTWESANGASKTVGTKAEAEALAKQFAANAGPAKPWWESKDPAQLAKEIGAAPEGEWSAKFDSLPKELQDKVLWEDWGNSKANKFSTKNLGQGAVPPEATSGKKWSPNFEESFEPMEAGFTTVWNDGMNVGEIFKTTGDKWSVEVAGLPVKVFPSKAAAFNYAANTAPKGHTAPHELGALVGEAPEKGLSAMFPQSVTKFAGWGGFTPKETAEAIKPLLENPSGASTVKAMLGNWPQEALAALSKHDPVFNQFVSGKGVAEWIQAGHPDNFIVQAHGKKLGEATKGTNGYMVNMLEGPDYGATLKFANKADAKAYLNGVAQKLGKDTQAASLNTPVKAGGGVWWNGLTPAEIGQNIINSQKSNGAYGADALNQFSAFAPHDLFTQVMDFAKGGKFSVESLGGMIAQGIKQQKYFGSADAISSLAKSTGVPESTLKFIWNEYKTAWPKTSSPGSAGAASAPASSSVASALQHINDKYYNSVPAELGPFPERTVLPEVEREAARIAGSYTTPGYHGTHTSATDVEKAKGLTAPHKIFASSDPKLAEMYALGTDKYGKMPGHLMQGSRIAPLWFDTRGYGMVDASGGHISDWYQKGKSAGQKAGGKGFIIKNVIDEPSLTRTSPPADVIVAIDPTTRKSAFASHFDPKSKDIMRNLLLGGSTGALALAGNALTGDEASAAPLKLFKASPHPYEKFVPERRAEGVGKNEFGVGEYAAENLAVGQHYFDKFARERGKAVKYELEVDISPDHVIDFGKPFSTQPKPVQEALERLGIKDLDARSRKAVLNLGRHGEYFLTAEESKKLGELGIAGVRYLDKHSREKGSGTHNYVLFKEPEVRKLIQKYGLPALLTGLGWESIPEAEKM